MKILEEDEYSQRCRAFVQLVETFKRKGRQGYFYHTSASCRFLAAPALAFLLLRLGSMQDQ